MNILFIALILSCIEGLTEFLPVSSTGHLILAEEFLHFSGDKAIIFTIVIQLGAIASVVVLYFRRFLGLLLPSKDVPFSGLRGIFLLFLTSLPAGLTGLLAGSFIKHTLFAPVPVLLSLVVGAIFMLVVESKTVSSYLEKRYREKGLRVESLDEITPSLALGIGCFQTLAVLWPGFSRSAATILGGMLLGCSRQTSAEYSFVAAVPIMIAATGYELISNRALFSASDIPLFTVGMLGSFFFALLAVKVFIVLVSRITLRPFAIYRLLLAPLVFYCMSF